MSQSGTKPPSPGEMTGTRFPGETMTPETHLPHCEEWRMGECTCANPPKEEK